MADIIDPVFPEIRKRKKKVMFDYEANDELINNPKDNFKINFFLLSLSERFILLKENNEMFKIIQNVNALKQSKEENILNHCKDLHLKLSNDKDPNDRDIDGTDLFEELKTLKCFRYQNNLNDTFSNIAVVLRIYLTLPVSVASGERSFSKLKLIKNYLRSSISQERLIDLSMISIENEIMDGLDLNELIKDFVLVSTYSKKINRKIENVNKVGQKMYTHPAALGNEIRQTGFF
jgi:hypothetical protein